MSKSNSVTDTRKSIRNLYKARSRSYPGSMKYMNISSQIHNLRRKEEEIINAIERT